MDIDSLLLDRTHSKMENPENSQPSHMDEELESFDLGELDILWLEDACRRKEFEKIIPQQIGKLEVVLFRAHQLKKLGVQPGSHWDGQRIIKE